MRRVGLGFVAQPYSIREIITAAQTAEELGYGSVWLTEDIWSGRDSFSILSCLALNTSQIRLGTAVIGVYSRHPLLLAMTFNALSELAPGRLILGIGAGMSWHPLLPYPEAQLPPLRAMRESITTVRELLAGGSAAFGDTTLDLTVSRQCFSGAIPPANIELPVYVGAMGPKMTRLTGELADGLILEIQMRRDAISARLEQLRIGAAEANRDVSSIEVVKLILMSVSEDGNPHENALGYVSREIARLNDSDVLQLGFDPERVRRLKNAYQQGDCQRAFGLLTSDMITTFVAAGTPDDCLRVIEEIVQEGVDLPILLPFGGDVSAVLEVGIEYARRTED